jgi:hypothetical protein
MANRAKQAGQQKTSALSEIPMNTASSNTHRASIVETRRGDMALASAKRKKRGADNVLPKKKLKPPDSTTTTTTSVAEKDSTAKNQVMKHNVTATRQYTNSGTKEQQPLESRVDTSKQQTNTDTTAEKRRDGTTATKSLEKPRDFTTKTGRHEQVKTSKEISLCRSVTFEQPTQLANKVESKERVAEMDDTTMDCTSDEESLQLSPESPTLLPRKETVKQDKAMVLKPRIEYAETSTLQEDLNPRLSMTTLADDSNPVHTPNTLVDERSETLPRTMEDLVRRESDGPIVTKGMLARARQAKADNEDVVAAMLKSGPPYKKREERSPTSDASMVGTLIRLPHERSDSVDGSEVTMLTTDSYLSDLPGEFVSKKRDSSKLDEDSPVNGTHKASPDDVSEVPDASNSRMSKSRKRSVSSGPLSVCEPDEGIDERGPVHYYEINGVKIPHVELPSGWLVHFSQSKQKIFYQHPDFGSTWHCPVVVSQPIPIPVSLLHSINHSSVGNVPIKQKNVAFHNEDDTESEDSATPQKQSLTSSSSSSISSRVCAAPSKDANNFKATTQAMEISKDYESDVSSLAGSVAENHGRTGNGRGELELDEQESSPPLVDEETVSAVQQRQVGRVTMDSTDLISTKNDKGPCAADELSSQGSKGSRHSHSPCKSKTIDSAESSDLDDSPPRQVAASRVSLVTEKEALGEDMSQKVVKELVSIAQFRGNNAGDVSALDLYGDSEAEEEDLVDRYDSHDVDVKATANGVDKDKEFLASLRNSYGDDSGSLAFASRAVDGSKTEDSKSVNQDVAIAHDHMEDIEAREEDAFPPMEDDPMEDSDAHSVTSKPRLHLDSLNDETVLQEEETDHIVAQRLASEKGNMNVVVKEQSIKNKPESFEIEIDEVVFGIQYDDIDLSPQSKRQSPIAQEKSLKHGSLRQTETHFESEVRAGSSSPLSKLDESRMMDNADDKSESFPPNETETPLRQNVTSPSDISASTKKSSPADDDSLSFSSEELVQASPQEDEHTVESPVGGTASMADSPITTTTKWKGYSYRILHPPHPLDSLFRIDELLKAARRRAERRKKGKKKKAPGGQRTSTRKRLVFE